MHKNRQTDGMRQSNSNGKEQQQTTVERAERARAAAAAAVAAVRSARVAVVFIACHAFVPSVCPLRFAGCSTDRRDATETMAPLSLFHRPTDRSTTRRRQREGRQEEEQDSFVDPDAHAILLVKFLKPIPRQLAMMVLLVASGLSLNVTPNISL